MAPREQANDSDENGVRSPLIKEHQEPELGLGQTKRCPSLHSHTAVIGASAAPIESLDYEAVESAVCKEDWRSRTRSERTQYTILKWCFVLIIGIGSGLTAFGINMAVENISGWKFKTTLQFMQNRQHFSACLVYTMFNVALVFVASILCTKVAPAAAGSGIPKVLGSICAVAGGLAVGKEGPLVHTGACIASILGQGGSKKYGLTCKWLGLFKNDRDRRDLVTCGAAAGVAAAFRAPVGGVLFALEEATSWWRAPLLWRVFFTNAIVAVVVRAAMAMCRDGACGLFSNGGFIIFDSSSVKSNFGLMELLPVVILGITGGLLGGLFNQVNILICTIRRDRLAKYGPRLKIAEACCIALVTSIVQYVIPLCAHCTPCPDPDLHITDKCPTYGRVGNFKNFYCPPGHYNELATLLFNTNDDAIRNLFSTGTFAEFNYFHLSIFMVTFYLLAVVTYGIAVPSGLFVPAIMCGATYGRIAGMAMVGFFGGRRIDEGTYALLGAASFLGGSMRMTVSLSVILLELTGNLEMLPLIMLVLLVSKMVGDSLNDGIYDLHVSLKKIPYLEPHPEQFMKELTAADAVERDPICFQGVERVEVLLQVLRSNRHSAFPIIKWVDGQPSLYGIVLRSHLLVLLQSQNFQSSSDCPLGPYSVTGHPLTKYSTSDFAKPGSGKGLCVEDVSVKEEDMHKYIDLHPFANTSPHTVLETMSLDKVFMLFRQLGLRHLCVLPAINKDSPIRGIITRKDLLPEYLLARHRLTAQGGRRLNARLSMTPL
eukprot:SM000088S23731  [mRNA]  locus=s88:359105:362896:- [translate_table: standard]